MPQLKMKFISANGIVWLSYELLWKPKTWLKPKYILFAQCAYCSKPLRIKKDNPILIKSSFMILQRVVIRSRQQKSGLSPPDKLLAYQMIQSHHLIEIHCQNQHQHLSHA